MRRPALIVVAFLTAMQVAGQALTGVVGDRWSKRGIVVAPAAGGFDSGEIETL